MIEGCRSRRMLGHCALPPGKILRSPFRWVLSCEGDGLGLLLASLALYLLESKISYSASQIRSYPPQSFSMSLIACIRNSNRLWASRPAAPDEARKAELVHRRGGFLISFCFFFFVNNLPVSVNKCSTVDAGFTTLCCAAVPLPVITWGGSLQPLFLDWGRQSQPRPSINPDRLMRAPVAQRRCIFYLATSLGGVPQNNTSTLTNT